MRRLFRHRGRRVTFVGLGALLALVGVVLVHDPMAAPGAKVLGETFVDSPTTFTITTTSDPTLYPGATGSPIELDFTNGLSKAIDIVSVSVTFTNTFPTTPAPGCDPTALTFGSVAVSGGPSPSATIHPTAPATALFSIDASGQHAYDTALALANQGDQDACRKLPLAMTYSATARYTDGSGTALTTSQTPVAVGASVTLTAAVSAANPIADSHNTVDDTGPGTPDGSANFYQCPTSSSCVSASGSTITPSGGALFLGSAPLVSGRASLTPPAYTMKGTFYYQAAFSSGHSTDFSDSVSKVVTEVVASGGCVVISTTGVSPVTGAVKGNVEVKSGTYWLNGGTITDNVTVDSGARFVATAGTINGSLTSNGGLVSLQNMKVTGPVSANNGGLDFGPGTTIGGNVTVNTSGPKPVPPMSFCSVGTSSAPVYIGGTKATPVPAHSESLLYYSGSSVPQATIGQPLTVYYNDDGAITSASYTDGSGTSHKITPARSTAQPLTPLDNYGGSKPSNTTNEVSLTFTPQGSGPFTLTVTDADGNQDAYTWSVTPPPPTPPVGPAANLTVQNLSSGSPLVEICETFVGGNLQYNNNSAPVHLGSSASCIGNTVAGDLQVQNNSAALTIGGSGMGTANSVGGTITVQKNAGGTLTDNDAGTNCQLQGDSPVVMGSGNTIKGVLQSPSAKQSCNVSGGA